MKWRQGWKLSETVCVIRSCLSSQDDRISDVDANNNNFIFFCCAVQSRTYFQEFNNMNSDENNDCRVVDDSKSSMDLNQHMKRKTSSCQALNPPKEFQELGSSSSDGKVDSLAGSSKWKPGTETAETSSISMSYKRTHVNSQNTEDSDEDIPTICFEPTGSEKKKKSGLKCSSLKDEDMPALCSDFSEGDAEDTRKQSSAQEDVLDEMSPLERISMAEDDDIPALISDGGSEDEQEENMDVDNDSDEEPNDIVFRRQDEHEPEILIDDFSKPAPQYSIPALLMFNDLQNPNVKYHQVMRQRLVANLDLIRRMDKFATLEHHRGCVNSLNFNPSGILLASGSDDLKIGLWDWLRKKLLMSFTSGHFANVFQSKFMPLSNDSLLVTSSRDGAVRLAELSEAGSTATTKSLCKHAGACHKIDVRPDSFHHILSCGEDAAVNYIDIREAKPTKCLVVSVDDRKLPLYSIMSNPLKSTEFIVTGRDKYVRVFDMRFLKPTNVRAPAVLSLCPSVLQESNLDFTVSSAVYNHTGSEILASYNDYNIFLLKNGPSDDEGKGSKPIQEYEGHRNNQTVKGVNFYGSASEYVVSGSDCGRVFFWDRVTGQIVHYVLADDIGAVNVLEPHPSHAYLATSGLAHTVKVWAPTAEEPSILDDLLEVIEGHHAERRRDLRHRRPGSDTDGRFIMMLMEHIRRRRNRGDVAAAQPHPVVAAQNAALVGENDGMPPLAESDEEEEPGGVHCGTV